jgi:hypothetical protein
VVGPDDQPDERTAAARLRLDAAQEGEPQNGRTLEMSVRVIHRGLMARPGEQVHVITSPEPHIEPTIPAAPALRFLDRFRPSALRRAAVGRFYGAGGMAVAPDSPAEVAAEVRALEANTVAKGSPPPVE